MSRNLRAEFCVCVDQRQEEKMESLNVDKSQEYIFIVTHTHTHIYRVIWAPKLKAVTIYLGTWSDSFLLL